MHRRQRPYNMDRAARLAQEFAEMFPSVEQPAKLWIGLKKDRHILSTVNIIRSVDHTGK